MQAAIAAKTPQLNASLRHVLAGFHNQKAQAPVDAMLLRLYEPLLFRGLSANNSSVRCNSLLLLFDAFPLQVTSESETSKSAEGVSRDMTATCSQLDET